MARQRNNIIMRSTRGMVGKQIVFKRRAGKSYVAAPPEVNENRIATANQLAAQQRFKTSVAYAKLAMLNINAKEAYYAAAKRGQSAFNVAFNDAYFGPLVLGIISLGYTGAVGGLVVVQATDDFKVNTVKVSIYNPVDVLIEEGAAVAAGDGLNWNYMSTVANANIAGCKIKATATDIPENEGTYQVML
jgi:hypothetical protein